MPLSAAQLTYLAATVGAPAAAAIKAQEASNTIVAAALLVTTAPVGTLSAERVLTAGTGLDVVLDTDEQTATIGEE